MSRFGQLTPHEMAIVGRCPATNMMCNDGKGNDIWKKLPHFTEQMKLVIGRCPNTMMACSYTGPDGKTIDLWELAKAGPPKSRPAPKSEPVISAEPAVSSPTRAAEPIAEPKAAPEPYVDPETVAIRKRLDQLKAVVAAKKAAEEARIKKVQETHAKQAAYGRDTKQVRPKGAGYATEAERIMGAQTGYYKPKTMAGLGCCGDKHSSIKMVAAAIVGGIVGCYVAHKLL